jgi:hypothetical protein
MRRIRCIVVLAEGGFKINGPPRVGKGPMESEEYQKMNKGASLPQPTQAGRIETCTELINQAMRCLENNDKQCVTRLIEELIKANCHDGRLIGKKIADRVRGVVHGLWLVSDDEYRCELLRMLKSLDVSKKWVVKALSMYTKMLNKWIAKCGIDWEYKMARSNIVRQLEDLLRRLGWSEVRMCEELWQFVGVDVDEFRKYSVEPCIWLEGLEPLRNLRRPYWFGLKVSDLVVKKCGNNIVLELSTTNSVDAIFFPVLLNMARTPGLKIEWKRVAPTAKYVRKAIALGYYVDLGIGDWPWPIKLNADELKRILDGFSDEELAKYVAGEIDGDGTVWYDLKNGYVAVFISACKKCPKRMVLGILRDIIAKRFGIIGRIYPLNNSDVLMFYDESAVRLLRLIRPFVHHPLRRLRIELILALHDGKISREAFEKLYKMTEYEYKGPDIKRNHALEALTRAAPQTHTHGESCHKKLHGPPSIN